MSLFPYLFIGVGGTGGKTVGMIHYHLRETLKRLGIGDEPPQGWQFLHIDVAANVDVRGVNATLHYDLPATSYVPLTNTQSTYVGLDDTISRSLTATGLERYLAWESWRPTPATGVPVANVAFGAGQYRTVGRVAAQAGLGVIAKAIQGALDRITAPEVQGELDEIERLLGPRPAPDLPKPAVVIIGSVAGGSGSGMLLDVCDVVRGLGGPAPDAVVFTPEVFSLPDGSMSPGIAPNTFMAVCELANAMWTVTSQHPTIGRDRLFDRAGVKRPSPADRGGPAGVYLVGRSSAGVTLQDADEVYAVVARSFAELALSRSLSDSLRAYGSANAAARATGTPDHLGLNTQPSSDLGTFGALGFGRVTLGREFFERYAAQRLLRLLALRLLDQHLTRHFKGDGKTDEQVLVEAVADAWPGFLAATGLSEAGTDHDDVTEALDPGKKLAGRLSTIQTQVATAIVAKADPRGRVQVPEARAEAALAVTKHCSTVEDDTLRTVTDRALRSAVDDWSKTVSDSLRHAVLVSVAAQGFPVTKRLLDKLAAEVRQAATELSGRELAHQQEIADKRLAVVRSGKAGEERVVKVGDALLETIAVQARMTLEAHAHAWALEHIAKVLEDARVNLVLPWRRAVEEADALLRGQARPSEGVRPLELWPGDVGVPTHLLPSRVEFTLDDLDAFPAMFVDLIALSSGDGYDPDEGEGATNAVRQVVDQILKAERLRLDDATRLRPAVYEPVWVPADGRRLTPKTTAAVRCHFSIKDLEARVHSWLHDETKLIGRHLHETWRGYLEDETVGQSVRDARHDRLVAQFGAALQVSRPLVRLSGPMVQEVHAVNVGNVPISLIVSELNVPGHLTELQRRLRDAAALAYGPLAQVRFTDNPASAAMALSTFSTPYHAVEIESIMRPVTSQYTALGQQTDFWMLRRARPLSEWVPLSPDALQALFTGWFTARCLGRARVVGEYPPRHEVYVPAAGARTAGWVRLRSPGVRQVTELNQVGILPELLAMTFLDAAQINSLQPLAPFQELIRLGSLVGSRTNPDPIRQWVSTGAGVVDAALSYFPDPLDTPEQRAGALRAQCDSLDAFYESEVTPDALAYVAAAQESLLPEVHSLLQNALDALRRSASGTRPRQTQ